MEPEELQKLIHKLGAVLGRLELARYAINRDDTTAEILQHLEIAQERLLEAAGMLKESDGGSLV